MYVQERDQQGIAAAVDNILYRCHHQVISTLVHCASYILNLDQILNSCLLGNLHRKAWLVHCVCGVDPEWQYHCHRIKFPYKILKQLLFCKFCCAMIQSSTFITFPVYSSWLSFSISRIVKRDAMIMKCLKSNSDTARKWVSHTSGNLLGLWKIINSHLRTDCRKREA